jgi:hypothetical protein
VRQRGGENGSQFIGTKDTIPLNRKSTHALLFMKKLSITFVAGLALLLFHATTHGQTSTLNYQGRLNDGAGPANGSYDLRFTLYSVAASGSPVALPLTNTATVVSNGLFTVTLDFGSAVFDGSDRWLEVAARTNGAASFTALTPRQRIASAPYATQARNAELLGGTNGTAFAAAAHTHAASAITSGAVSPARGGTGLDTSATTAGSLLRAAGGGLWTTVPPTVNGQVLKLSGGVPTWAADNDSGGTVTSVGTGTGLTGGPIMNSGTLSIDTAVVPRLGASNNFAGVNTFSNTSNSFIGAFTGNGANLTNLSGAALAAGSVTNSKLATNSVTSDKILDGTVVTADLADGVVSSNKLAGNSVTTDKILDATIATVDLADGAVSSNKVSTNVAVWTRTGTNAAYGSGNVGIGTASPAERLHVREDAAGAITFPIKVANEAAATYGTAAGLLFQADDGPDRGKGALIYERTDTWNRGKFHFLQEPNTGSAIPGIGNAALTIANNGNVGIANTNPAARLDVAGAIRIQVGGTTVTVNTDGTVNITSSTNITFTSTGDLNLSGRNVTIGASQSMNISGGSAVNINSSATMNVHASGALDLQGTPIDLN